MSRNKDIEYFNLVGGILYFFDVCALSQIGFIYIQITEKNHQKDYKMIYPNRNKYYVQIILIQKVLIYVSIIKVSVRSTKPQGML